MKRFWKEVAVEATEGGFRVTLDGRPIRTQGGGAQVVPTLSLAEALAEEWRGQGEEVDPARFVLRDMADFAIDQVRPDRAATIAELLGYAETDTLCYRADPEEHLYRRQLELWEPLLASAEARWGVHFTRVSGILHRPQPEATIARLQGVLEGLDEFSLAALRTMTPIAASLTVALAALEDSADTQALFAAANCEQDWQAELWGWDLEAENARARRLSAFEAAAAFARMAKA
ncbi:MAG: molecular chaperone [Porphyrobacter sp.]|nr:molecular chaperone [Porphyrobacter sp.]